MTSSQSASGGRETLQQAAPRSSTPTLTQTTNLPFRPRPEQAILRLRGAHTQIELEDDGEGGTKRRQRIQWAEDVIDNEGLGRKKSKGMVCFLSMALE